jgi:hypothetical protein
LRRHPVLALDESASTLARARRCESLRPIRAIPSRVEAAPRLAQGVIQKKISHGESPDEATFVAWRTRIHAGISSSARTHDNAHWHLKNPGIIDISEEQGAARRGAAQLYWRRKLRILACERAPGRRGTARSFRR